MLLFLFLQVHLLLESLNVPIPFPLPQPVLLHSDETEYLVGRLLLLLFKHLQDVVSGFILLNLLNLLLAHVVSWLSTKQLSFGFGKGLVFFLVIQLLEVEVTARG